MVTQEANGPSFRLYDVHLCFKVTVDCKGIDKTGTQNPTFYIIVIHIFKHRNCGLKETSMRCFCVEKRAFICSVFIPDLVLSF